MIRTGIIALSLCLAACSRQNTADSQSLPPIPKLELARYRPQVRAQLEGAYQAVEAKPNDADANGRLGMLLHAFEQIESAAACYRRARRFDSARLDWAYYLGLVEALLGDNPGAAANLEDAVRIDPGYVPARIKLAEVLLVSGKLEESRKISQALLKDDPQIAPAYYWLGRVESANGSTDQAIKWYAKACDAWPTYGTAHYALALAYQKDGQPDQAQRHMAVYQKYQANADPQPEDPLLEAVRALDNSALAHLMKGVDLENAGQGQQAIAEDEEAVRQDPKLVQAYANLISLYARAGEPEKAEQAYGAVLAINPNLPQSHYDYGVFLVSRGHFAEAEVAFRKALASSPHYAEAHSNLGAMLERRGKLVEAAREYRAAIDDKPNFRQAYYQLGRLELAQGNAKEAIRNLQQTLTPEDEATPRFLFALGAAYAEANDFAPAKENLQRAADRATSMGQDALAAQIRAMLDRVDERASAK